MDTPNSLSRIVLNALVASLLILLFLSLTWHVFAASPSREETMRTALQALAVDARDKSNTIASLRDQLVAARAAGDRVIPAQTLQEFRQRDATAARNASRAAEVTDDIRRRQEYGQRILQDIHNATVYSMITSAANVVGVLVLIGIVVVLNRRANHARP